MTPQYATARRILIACLRGIEVDATEVIDDMAATLPLETFRAMSVLLQEVFKKGLEFGYNQIANTEEFEALAKLFTRAGRTNN